MNRLTKLICWFAIAEMAVAGFGAISARWADIVHHPQAIGFLGWRIIAALLFAPGWAMFGIWRTERRLRPQGLVLSDGYRRLTESGIVGACLLMAGLQTWFAAILAAGHMLSSVSPQQVGMLVGGGMIVILGNASAKLAPPTGPAAPDPGAWIRGSLRNGWAVVLLGMLLMAAAFAPVEARVAVSFTCVPVVLAISLSRRRLLRGGDGPHAPA